jgi:CRISPR-associated protein Csm4
MGYLKFTIAAETAFGTPPVSDTLFGQLCCVLKLLGADLDALLKSYDAEPFAVLSHMFPKGLGYIPPLPKPHTEESEKEIDVRKKLKKLNMAEISRMEEAILSLKNGVYSEYLTEEPVKSSLFGHNSVNRLTGPTKLFSFADYYLSDCGAGREDFSLYAYVKDEYKDLLKSGIETMGRYGFGRDASSGRGRYSVISIEEAEFSGGSETVYTLGNCALAGIEYKMAFYAPITRFGKHGGERSHTSTPFKAPVVMARQGALISFDKPPLAPYIGCAPKGFSRFKDAVMQGWSLYIPIRLSADAFTEGL